MPRFCRALVELELSAAQHKYDVRTGWAILKKKNIFIRKCSGKLAFSSGELFIDIHRVYIKLLRVRVARTCIPLF